MPNPILDELHHVREQLIEEAGGTLHGLVEMLRQSETSEREQSAKRKPTSPTPTAPLPIDTPPTTGRLSGR